VAQPVVSIRDHQVHSLEPALHQALQEACPERLGFGRPNAKADDLAPAVDVRRHRDYRGAHFSRVGGWQLARDERDGFCRPVRLNKTDTYRKICVLTTKTIPTLPNHDAAALLITCVCPLGLPLCPSRQ